MQAIPGVLEYEGARIQLLDLPGIVQDAAKGLLRDLDVGVQLTGQVVGEVDRSCR